MCGGPLGARRRSLDALVCVYVVAEAGGMGSSEDQDSRTLIEAGPAGWWYTALVPGGRRTVAWLTDHDLLRGHPWRDSGWFRSHVGATRHVSALIEQHGYGFASAPRCTSAASARLEPSCGPGWLTVGDAALALDPLSSQGLFNALSTGIRAAAAISGQAGGDVASKEYEEAVRSTWASYVKERLSNYRAERRWAEEVFWGRRQDAEGVRLVGR